MAKTSAPHRHPLDAVRLHMCIYEQSWHAPMKRRRHGHVGHHVGLGLRGTLDLPGFGVGADTASVRCGVRMEPDLTDATGSCTWAATAGQGETHRRRWFEVADDFVDYLPAKAVNSRRGLDRQLLEVVQGQNGEVCCFFRENDQHMYTFPCSPDQTTKIDGEGSQLTFDALLFDTSRSVSVVLLLFL